MCHYKNVFAVRMTVKHIVAIGVDKSLSNIVMYENICLGKIKKLYKSSGKCDDQQQYKDIIKEIMVSTPEGFTDKSPISPSQSVTVKTPSARK